MSPGSAASVAATLNPCSCPRDIPGGGTEDTQSAESQGCGLGVVTVGHISFHTQGEEIADGLADPAFFQKVVTLVNPGRSGNRKAPETYRLTGVKQTSELPSWALGHGFLRPFQ